MDILELIEKIRTLPRYGCVGPEGDYDAGMEVGAGNYVDGDELDKLLAAADDSPWAMITACPNCDPVRLGEVCVLETDGEKVYGSVCKHLYAAEDAGK